MITRALQPIFQESTSNLTLKISFYKILNNQVFDLINPGGQQVPVAVHEVPKIGTLQDSTAHRNRGCLCRRSLGSAAERMS
jgi:hypothetical protein